MYLSNFFPSSLSRMSQPFLLLYLALIIVQPKFTPVTKIAATTPSSDICLLMGKPSIIASPSLSQCYIYTKDSCCTNLHDSAIADALEALVSPSCTDDFDELI